MYRLIISEKARDPYGRALEILGSYNPYTKKLQAKEDRIKYWLEKGSQMSPTVNNLLLEKEIIKGEETAEVNDIPMKEEISEKKKEEASGESEKEEEVKEDKTPTEEPKKEEVPQEEPKTDETPTEEKKEEAPQKTEATEDKDKKE